MSDSHPVVEVYRQRHAHLCTSQDEQARAQFDTFKDGINTALTAAEPALANNPPDTVPDLLRAKAFLDGIAVWARCVSDGHVYRYGTHIVSDGYTYPEDNMTRITNDDTLVPELLEAREYFIDRSLKADDKQEAAKRSAEYHDDILTLITGRHSEGLRSLGGEFDKRIMDARAEYKRRLLKNPKGDHSRAFETYRDALLQIVFDFLATHDKEQEVRDRKPEIVIDRTKQPAPTPAAPKPVVEARPRLQAEVLKTFSTDDDKERGHFVGLDREEPAPINPKPDEVQDAVADSRARRDARLQDAWKRKPPALKRKRKPQYDPVE